MLGLGANHHVMLREYVVKVNVYRSIQSTKKERETKLE